MRLQALGVTDMEIKNMARVVSEREEWWQYKQQRLAKILSTNRSEVLGKSKGQQQKKLSVGNSMNSYLNFESLKTLVQSTSYYETQRFAVACGLTLIQVNSTVLEL